MFVVVKFSPGFHLQAIIVICKKHKFSVFGVIVVVWIFPIVSSAKTIDSHLYNRRNKYSE